jgi:hypothetical protein
MKSQTRIHLSQSRQSTRIHGDALRSEPNPAVGLWPACATAGATNAGVVASRVCLFSPSSAGRGPSGPLGYAP